MRAVVTPGVDHVVLRLNVSSDGEDAYLWLSYEVLRGDLDSATLRFDGMYLPSGPENRLAIAEELENLPIFDIGRIR